MMIIWQTVPLNILHKSFLHFYTTWLDKQKSMRAKRGVGCVQIQIQLQWRLLPIPLDLVLFWQIHTPVLLGLEVIFYSRTVAEKGMLFVWKLWRRKNKNLWWEERWKHAQEVCSFVRSYWCWLARGCFQWICVYCICICIWPAAPSVNPRICIHYQKPTCPTATCFCFVSMLFSFWILVPIKVP